MRKYETNNTSASFLWKKNVYAQHKTSMFGSFSFVDWEKANKLLSKGVSEL